MTRLFIGKVNKNVSKVEIEEELALIAQVSNIVVVKDKTKSSNYIFFEVTALQEAQKFLSKPVVFRGKEHYIQVSHKSQVEDSNLNTHRAFISNIPVLMSDEDLKHFFEQRFGKVEACFSVKNENGLSLGYGFVDFKDRSKYQEVIQMKKLDYKGKWMIIKGFKQKALPKSNITTPCFQSSPETFN